MHYAITRHMKEGVARPVEAAAFRSDGDGGAGHLKRFPWADAEVIKELFLGDNRKLAALHLLGWSLEEMAAKTGLPLDVIGERLSAIGATLKREVRKRRRKR